MYQEIQIPCEYGNRLTERLAEQGITPETDSREWPEDVWSPDGKHFCLKWDWKYNGARIWEAPCGVMHRGGGQPWGELSAQGVMHCIENGNPLFRCPFPWKDCEFRKATLPPGISCEFHPAEHPYDPERDIDRIDAEQCRKRRLRADRQPEGCEVPCGCMHEAFTEDGEPVWQFELRLNTCRDCQNSVCAFTRKPRDLSPANIFFDVYEERETEEGFNTFTDRILRKGEKVFEKPMPRGVAELALKAYLNDPESRILPGTMGYTLRAALEGKGAEFWMVSHHGEFNGKRVRIRREIRNLRVESRESRDLLEDLQNVAAGIEVRHASDEEARVKKAAKENRARAKIDGYVRKLSGKDEEVRERALDRLDREKDPVRDAVLAELARREEQKRKKETKTSEQVGFIL